MFVYKALYKKMMDDLKDAGMWIDWSEQLMETHPKVAEFLMESAKERLEESFPRTHEKFEEICEQAKGRDGVYMDEVICDHIMEWHDGLKRKLEYVEKMETKEK